MPSERDRRAWRRLRTLSLFALLTALTLAACAPHGVYHVVEPGQTLYRIAKTYGIDEGELARINGITDPTRLESGQRLYIPGTTLQRKVATVDPPKTPPRPAVSSQPQAPKAKAGPKTETKAGKPKAEPSGPVKETASALKVQPAPGIFLWPVRGKVVAEFGAADGKSNKGIDIAVPHGTPVTAAAAGKVIYSGNGIRGYGNLVILEHADSYFTVYGFNAKNLVNVDSFVGQGDRIALSGAPAGGKSPRLHFEIRKGKTAVNPIFFLP